MGQKMVGATLRDNRITLRLNEEENAELERKRRRRGLQKSDYFRQLMKEDQG